MITVSSSGEKVKEMGVVEIKGTAGKRDSWEQRPGKGVWKLYIKMVSAIASPSLSV